MRFAVISAVLLAVVSTALVAVCQHSETRRVQRRVWQLDQRRIRLERQAQRLLGAIDATRTPRRLLVEHDLGAPARGARPSEDKPIPSTPDATAPRSGVADALPSGFVTGRNFEGGR